MTFTQRALLVLTAAVAAVSLYCVLNRTPRMVNYYVEDAVVRVGGWHPIAEELMMFASGVIVEPNGHILTCAHVHQKNIQMYAQLLSGDTVQIELIGKDDTVDLALYRIKDAPESLRKVWLGSSPYKGQEVVLLGHPVGLEWVLTEGIISQIGEEFVLSSAVANPGNSGCGAFNMDGELVGIVKGIILVVPASMYQGHTVLVSRHSMYHFLRAHNKWPEKKSIVHKILQTVFVDIPGKIITMVVFVTQSVR